MFSKPTNGTLALVAHTAAKEANNEQTPKILEALKRAFQRGRVLDKNVTVIPEPPGCLNVALSDLVKAQVRNELKRAGFDQFSDGLNSLGKDVADKIHSFECKLDGMAKQLKPMESFYEEIPRDDESGKLIVVTHNTDYTDLLYMQRLSTNGSNNQLLERLTGKSTTSPPGDTEVKP